MVLSLCTRNVNLIDTFLWLLVLGWGPLGPTKMVHFRFSYFIETPFGSFSCNFAQTYLRVVFCKGITGPPQRETFTFCLLLSLLLVDLSLRSPMEICVLEQLLAELLFVAVSVTKQIPVKLDCWCMYVLSYVFKFA